MSSSTGSTVNSHTSLAPSTATTHSSDSNPVVDGRLTFRLAFSVFAIVIGSSFQFGYHIGCVNPPATLIVKWMVEDCGFEESSAKLLWSIAVSAFCLGGIIGGLMSSIMADRLGRKCALLLNNIPLVLGVVTMMAARWTHFPYLLVLGRIFIGINAGICSGVTSMYIMELSPSNLRGTISSVHQLTITISILIAMIIGLPELLGTPDHWQYIFGISLIFCAVQLVSLPLAPESPKYSMAIRQDEDAALSALQSLRGTDDVQNELNMIKKESNKSESSLSLVSLLFSAQFRWPLVVSVVLMASQQLSGINAAMFYSTASFSKMGLSQSASSYATVGMGAVNVLMTVVSMWLVDHPRFGRRSLLLVGLSGMLVASAVIVGCLSLEDHIGSWSPKIACGMIFLFVISFATGPGSIPWFYVTEIFPSDARAAASAIAAVANWICNGIVGVSFLQMMEALGSFTFGPFCVCLILSILFVYGFLPETKGLSTEEAQEAVEEKRPSCC